MNERTLCGVIKANGKDCDESVPPDAPVNICLTHMRRVYLHIRDIIEQSPDLGEGRGARELNPTTVYYVRFGDRIKIGTTGNLWARIAQLPCDRLLATEPGGFDVEAMRHEQFKAARINASAEWFRDCPEIRKHVNALRRQYGDPVEKRYPPTATAPVLEDAPWEDPGSWKPRVPKLA